MMNQHLSIVFPTSNRPRILGESLENMKQVIGIENIFIYIIDNGAQGNALPVVNRVSEDDKLRMKYYSLNQGGLSNAKNFALKTVGTPYVLFLDDDCYLEADSLKSCFDEIDANTDMCIGSIKRWEKEVPTWILDHYFISNYPSSVRCVMDDWGYARGGIMLLKVDTALRIEGFDKGLGMAAGKIGYGEDTLLAKEIVDDGGTLIYNPKIQKFHCSHYTSVNGFLIAEYEKGKAYLQINEKKESLVRYCAMLLKSLVKAVWSCLVGVILRKKVKQIVVESLRGSFLHLGYLAGFFIVKRENK